jgi:hypothetical protein
VAQTVPARGATSGRTLREIVRRWQTPAALLPRPSHRRVIRPNWPERIALAPESILAGADIPRRKDLQMPQESPSSARLSAARIGQIVLGLIWSIDGLLKLQPFFFHDFAQQVIDPNAAGQPKLLGDPITFIGSSACSWSWWRYRSAAA